MELGGGGITQYYSAEILSANDYYPGGMVMPGREYNTDNYRYSINGQEKELELNKNITTALYWEYDSRVGRRWNVDPVNKPWQRDYVVFTDNPVWRVDPNGDDDFFNADGTFSHRTKTGTSIKIMTGQGIKLLSQILPNTASNIKTQVNIVNYYARMAGVNGEVPVGISPNTSGRGDGAALAFHGKDGIAVSAKGGINPSLNNFNNLKSVLNHEDLHKDDYKKEDYKFSDHTSVYENAIGSKLFGKTSNEFKIGQVEAYMSYLLGALKAEEIDEKRFQEKTSRMNKDMNKFGIVITAGFSGSGIPSVKVSGKNDEGKPIITPFIDPATKPQ